MIRYAPHPATGAPADCDHLSDLQLQGLRQRLVHLLGAEVVRSCRTDERHTAPTMRNDLIEMRQALRDALHKIDEEVYGRCELCRGPMSYEQLERVPYARCCATCLHDEL